MLHAKKYAFLTEELTKKLSDLEDLIIETRNRWLFRGLKDGVQNWQNFQIINVEVLRKQIKEIVALKLAEIHTEIEDTLTDALDVISIEIENKTMKIDENGIIFNQLLKQSIKSNDTEIDKLIDVSIASHKKNIFEIAGLVQQKNTFQDLTADISGFGRYDEDKPSGKVVYSFSLREATKNLFDEISKYTTETSVAGTPVRYSNGRMVSWRSYIEMKQRTDIQHLRVNMLDDAMKMTGVDLVLISEHADCASDHVEIQGRVCTTNPNKYFNKSYLDWNIVKEMLKRPNCRHTESIITPEQAENPEETKKNLRLLKSKYKDEEDYKELQQQRYYERQVRKYKTLQSTAKINEENAPTDELKAIASATSQRYGVKALEWQDKIKSLVKSNKALKRMPRREEIDKIATDLGVNYQRKWKREGLDFSNVEPYQRTIS